MVQSELKYLSTHALVFVAFVKDNATKSSIPFIFFFKSCKIFCAKPKEVDPSNLNFCLTNKCFDSTQIYNKQQSIKMKWIRAVNRNTFFVFIENIYTRYSILLAQ